MFSDATRDAFLSRARELSQVVKEHLQSDSYFLIVSHHDADGLASAGILGSALSRAGARFTMRIVEELRDDIVAELSAVKSDITIFSDIGSGYMDTLSEYVQGKEVLVLDHHPPSATVPSAVQQLNPHEFGIDGARLVSASGICYFVAREISSENMDLSTVGVVGALGDMQDKNENRSLIGLNELMVEDGLDSGALKVDSDLVLYGRETRPIHRALAFTTTPYLPGLSGREDNCLTLLSGSGISIKDGERFRTVADLTKEEKQRLLNAIIAYLSSISFQSNVVLDMVGSVYTLTQEPPGSPTRDGREYAALLNACGRTGNSSIGIGVGLGDRTNALQEANDVVTNYRKTLANYMEWLTKTPGAIQKLKTVWVIRGENQIHESMTGAFSSILSSAGNLSPDHAIIVMTGAKDGGFKMSARAPEKLLRMGVNLGAALNITAKRYNGFGGGHDVAAGAHIKVQNPDEFLRELDLAIVEQMKNVGS